MERPPSAAPGLGARLVARLGGRSVALVILGACLWTAANAWTWPAAMSFGDEVGYVGQARLFLEGRVRPQPGDPGIWHHTPEGGLIAKYPLSYPALLAPLVGLAPRAAFVLGIAAALALMYLTARILSAWGRDPVWSLLVLAQPAIAIVSRTLMVDLLLSLSLVATYLALRRDRLPAVVALVAATVALKPTGTMLIAFLFAGEAAARRADLLARRPAAWRRLGAGVAGVIVGMAVVVALNYLSNGTPRYGYEVKFGPPFWGPQFLLVAGVAHAKSLLLVPPLLIAGVWPFWRRRDLGPVAVIAGLCGMMSIYFFVDWGRNWADSLVLSQRLILPAVAFLMIGYAAWLDELARKLPPLAAALARRLLPAVLVALPLGAALQIGLQHRRWQQAMKEALATLEEVAHARGVTEVGLTGNALKYGLLFRGRTVLFPGTQPPPELVLCATKNASYRVTESDYSCVFPGYRSVSSIMGTEILVRDATAPSPDDEPDGEEAAGGGARPLPHPHPHPKEGSPPR